jgi:hypothetical protein
MQLAVALDRLLGGPRLRTEYGRATAHREKTEFNLDMMARRTIDIRDEVGAG